MRSLALLACTTFAATAGAQPVIDLVQDADCYGPADQVVVTVRLMDMSPASQINAGSFELVYDNTILDYDETTPVTGAGAFTTIDVLTNVNEGAGTMFFAVSTPTPVTTPPAQDMAAITFNIVGGAGCAVGDVTPLVRVDPASTQTKITDGMFGEFIPMLNPLPPITIDDDDPVVAAFTVPKLEVGLDCQGTATFSTTITDNCNINDAGCVITAVNNCISICNVDCNVQGEGTTFATVSGSVTVCFLEECPCTVEVEVFGIDDCGNRGDHSDPFDVNDVTPPAIPPTLPPIDVGDVVVDAKGVCDEVWVDVPCPFVECEADYCMTYTSEPALAIPDDVAPGVSDTITVPDSFDVLDLKVALNITHTWVGDLCVTLSKDGGPEIVIMQRIDDASGLVCDANGCCGCSSDNVDCTLWDGAADAINDQCGWAGAALTGTYYSESFNLSTFVGEDAAGDWTLHVNDNAAGDTGVLNSWSLILNNGNTSDNCTAFGDLVIWNSRTGYSCDASGYYPVKTTTTITWTVADICDQTSTTYQDVIVGNALNELALRIRLSPNIDTGNLLPDVLTRALTFWLYEPGCTDAVELCEEIAFDVTDGGPVHEALADVTIQVPCGNWTCLMVKDEFHTLRVTMDSGGAGLPQDTAGDPDVWDIDFATPDQDLLGGDLDNDCDIDIVDFGGCLEFCDGIDYGGDGDTVCGVDPPPANFHCDISGDGNPGGDQLADCTFIIVNFLMSCGPPCPDCSPLPDGPGFAFETDGFNVAPEPIMQITVDELWERGLGHLEVADLNHDGWLDVFDMVAYIMGERPETTQPKWNQARQPRSLTLP